MSDGEVIPAPAPALPATDGRVLGGRYQLDAAVGQGGMAQVFRGFDAQLRRTVAVKVLHPHLANRPEIRRRFDREAHAVARLHHPHILDVYDFSGPEAEPSYLVTEFIPGRSLRLFAEAHPFDPPELAICAALPLCEALEHAHAAGVVHRDIKPENVMVRDDGLLKLTDFGIAALLDPDEKFTVTGTILGSPAHLAPETIEGRPADPRSDLFSLGTLLFWLSTGRLPFVAPSPAALLRQILDGSPPDPRQLRPSVSDGLARVLQRLLERDPDRRYQRALDVRRDLLALLADAGIAEPALTLAAFATAPSPEQEARNLRDRLVWVQLRRGEEATREHRTSAALAAYGRALALEPGQPDAKAQVAALRQRASRRQLAVRTSGGFALCAALALGIPMARKGPAQVRPAGEAAAAAAGSAAAPALTPPPTPAQTQTPAQTPPPKQTQTPPQTPPPTQTQPPPRPPPRPAASDKPPASRTPRPLAAAATVRATLLVHWVWGHVNLDGVDLGENTAFVRDLTVGPHRVTVSHDCCADRSTVLDVKADQLRYTLEPGPPKPARLAVVGAPADAQVLLDGSVIGSVRTLPERDLSTDPQPTRKATLTVGDRSGPVTLFAGRTTPIDFLKLGRGEP